MAALFDQFGLRFSYPENWSIEVTEDSPDNQTVVVFGPATAFWQLSQHPASAELERLFDEALSALRTEYRQIEVEPDSSTIEGVCLEGFSVHFFYLDLVTTCRLRGWKSEGAVYLLVCQAEDREFSQVEAVFEAILASLLQNLP